MRLITMQNITFSYAKDRPILKDLSLTIDSGEFIIIAGSNGCGKSTIFRLLMEYVRPDSGTIKKSPGIAIAYIAQDIAQSLFMELTVEENLLLMHIPLTDRTFIKQFLAGYNEKLPDYMEQPVKFLSGGEKQALALAIKLFHTPDLLLLDEHTSALDPESEKYLMDLTNSKIAEKNITTLMSTHKIGTIVNYGTRVVGINRGAVIFDEKQSADLCEKCVKKIYR